MGVELDNPHSNPIHFHKYLFKMSVLSWKEKQIEIETYYLYILIQNQISDFYLG